MRAAERRRGPTPCSPPSPSRPLDGLPAARRRLSQKTTQKIRYSFHPVSTVIMRASSQPQTDLVLVGGGHSHVQVLESFAVERPRNTRVTLVVDRPIAMYSGMVPGFVAGQYRQEELEIDVLPLARRVGARIVMARATRIDAAAKRIHLEGRPEIAFDVASINVGSTVAGLSTSGVREHAIPTRPIGAFVARVDALLAALHDQGQGAVRVAVVGAGVGGVELAFAMDHRIRQLGRAVEATLVDSGPRILSGSSAGMRRRALRVAGDRGIRVVTGRRVERVEPGRVHFEEDGSGIEFDLLLWVTGAAGSSLFRDSNLATDRRGFARVRSTLQLEEHDHIFAVGDCATLTRHPNTPKAGVYAVRQGPVLSANLRRALAGDGGLERYRPQHDFLALINTGDGGAIGGKWSLSFEGRWVFDLKDRIDRKFMRRFQPLADGGRATAFDSPMAATGPEPDGVGDSETEVPCGGCAAKLGQEALRRALHRLPVDPDDATVELGLAEADDAACYISPGGQRIVSGVDQFRAFTDDPYLVGRVAAVNAASDLFAKGVTARFAQALVALPEGASGPAREETLFQVMAGATAAFLELGVTLVGGHTTTASELLVGFHVEGFADSDQELLRLDALVPERSLILTKALGTGVLFRADMMGRARGPWFEEAVASMLRPNLEAAKIGRKHGARAATDVTGFGLAGHLSAMLQASGCAAVLDLAALPDLAGVIELLEAGLRSTFHAENARIASDLEIDGSARRSPRLPLLFDPQTSGGLLFAVAHERAESALEALLASGHAAALVGRTIRLESEPEAARLRIIQSSPE